MYNWMDGWMDGAASSSSMALKVISYTCYYLQSSSKENDNTKGDLLSVVRICRIFNNVHNAHVLCGGNIDFKTN